MSETLTLTIISALAMIGMIIFYIRITKRIKETRFDIRYILTQTEATQAVKVHVFIMKIITASLMLTFMTLAVGSITGIITNELPKTPLDFIFMGVLLLILARIAKTWVDHQKDRNNKTLHRIQKYENRTARMQTLALASLLLTLSVMTYTLINALHQHTIG